MHCEWRLHRQFIMWCAEKVNNNQVIEDPNVSVFNVHRFFYLNVVTRACAEYVNFIAKHSAAPASPLSPINGNAAAARSRATPAKYQTPGKPKGGLCTVKAAPGAKSKSARKRARKKKANKKAQRQGTGFATPREFVAPSPA